MSIHKAIYLFHLIKTLIIWRPRFGQLGTRTRLGRCRLSVNPKAFKIGHHTMISDDWVLVDLNKRDRANSSARIEIGDWARIQHDFQCNAYTKITIGDHCLIAPRVFICDADHVADSSTPGISVSTKFESDPVTIGDSCWIGVNASILKGVTLGRNSIVAAGAVVTKSFPDNSIIGGVPAKLISENRNNQNSSSGPSAS